MTNGCAETAARRASIAGFASRAAVAENSTARGGAAPPRLSACPELDCLRHLLPPAILAAAALRASKTGVGADRALIAAGIVSEEAYLAAVTGSTGIPFEPLDDLPRTACPLPDERLPDAAAFGILPIGADGDVRFAIAPRNFDMRLLVESVRAGADVADKISLTTSERLQQFVARHSERTLAHRAADGLHAARPDLSAAGRNSTPFAALSLFAATVFVLGALRINALAVLTAALGIFFLAWAGLRIVTPLITRPSAYPVQDRPDDLLPVFTVIVPLYRESAALPGLLAALRDLDYPKEKLDIKIVLEPDDRATRARLEFMRLGAPFELIVAPAAGPRTKPKALNAALAFAHGEFVAVYDAEDRPDPDQLRRALDAFAACGENLACVQASLTIDNTADSWLARLFTAEYAGLFDVFLPCLSARRWPLPLGGTSNHFRASVLRRIGAWDPHNVTEDADLGMRLARFGYRATTIASTTHEEAPARLAPWLKQRTRWMKGWMQTWLVHMRAPRRLLRDLGTESFSVFQLLMGGSVLAALVHPIFLAVFLWQLAEMASGVPATPQFALHAATLAIGYLASITLAIAGLARRRLLVCAWVLLLMPLYWLLLSAAAWRALYQLLRDPYRWEKTEHGLAQTSRLAATAGVFPSGVKGTAANRPRPPPAGA